MPYYVMLTKLTSEGRKTVTNNPRRVSEVNKEAGAMGAKLIAQYAMLGPWDFVNIVEAPSNEVIARVSSQLGSRGTIEVLTMPAITMQEYVREIETANIIKK